MSFGLLGSRLDCPQLQPQSELSPQGRKLPTRRSEVLATVCDQREGVARLRTCPTHHSYRPFDAADWGRACAAFAVTPE